ncbi:MAG: hypothetical protein COV96_02600 [Candidatus Zambryskibacteria bacterium CG11_big_fil_rev_8_21_14_0_20_42_18]|uniref:Uncharacterized protein n=1 Tax=Candidatus Zambryskibacteria bacterium CG_4_9_14_3_um_filter_42_15 TaxID=1975112 RepID=A0A2M7WSR3_9BACT|nr:MAG: hypothetical protein COV96_02600 [Candidatus Zambryskibacteria bacterium CG11_big_fil_rev_8_21_14_0_20_42_18]PJA33024.1 MAG: hypothetical protein CO185_00780 [Candidatus Zambryskibacteria bacterium CG_4_9_14_3_um_filter_42_15]
MPHISSRKLDKVVSKKLWSQLLKTFKDAGKRSATNAIVSELLTYTEKIMLAKRLAIILLLDRGIPQHVISKELNVSISTVTRMSLNVEIGKYNEILKISGKKGILDVLEKIILMGMPPRVGRGRWNHWGRFTP